MAIAMAVAGVVLLGILYAIGQWGVCCGPGLSKPITGDSTWAKPPNPWISGQAANPSAGKAHHKSKADEGSSGGNASAVGLLAAIKPHGKGSRPSLAEGSIPTGDTGQPETAPPPSGTASPPGNTAPTDNCAPVIDVLTGLGLADCAPAAGASDHNDSSGNHNSGGNGNHHSSNGGGSSDNANPTALANDNPHGSDKDKEDHGDHGDHGDRGNQGDHGDHGDHD